MWLLKSIIEGEERVFYVTLQKKVVTIGRSNADVNLENDSSISRKHCALHLAQKDACPMPVLTRTGLWVVDSGSKYGTFVKTADDFLKIDPNVPTLLSHGCIIRFGIIHNCWSVEYKPILICTSLVPSALKTDLRQKMHLIGGDIMPSCDKRSSYCIASSISLTVKVLLAMINGIPIVKPSFIDELMEAIGKNRLFPDPRLCRPAMTETAVRVEDVNLEPGFKRNALFTGLQFFVLSDEHLENFKQVVEAAGGTISLLDFMDKEKLLQKGAVMLESFKPGSSQLSQTPQVSQTTLAIHEFLKKHGRRIVPDREIPLAIAYSSITRMCNAVSDNFSSGPVVEPLVPIPFSQSTIFEDGTEIRDPITLEQHGIVDCSYSEKPDCDSSQIRCSQLQPVQASGGKNCSRPQVSSSSLARKRGGSLDIFDEENSRRKILAVEGGSASRSVAGSIRSIKTPLIDSIHEEFKVDCSVGKSTIDSQLRCGSGLLSRSQRSESDIQDICDNPFGKRKASTEEQPAESAKRNKLSAKPTTTKNTIEESEKLTTIGITSPSSPDSFQFQRPQPLPAISKPQTSRSSINLPSLVSMISHPSADTDPMGWIDMTHRKDEEKLASDALSSTIIMLSLVTLAQARNRAISEATSDDPQNVKVFKKQVVPEHNRTTVEFQSHPSFQDD